MTIVYKPINLLKTLKTISCVLANISGQAKSNDLFVKYNIMKIEQVHNLGSLNPYHSAVPDKDGHPSLQSILRLTEYTKYKPILSSQHWVVPHFRTT